jgi:hypothetical protein
MLKACALVAGLLLVGCGGSSSSGSTTTPGAGGATGGKGGISLGGGGKGGGGSGGAAGGSGGAAGGSGGAAGGSGGAAGGSGGAAGGSGGAAGGSGGAAGGSGGTGSTRPECQTPSCFDFLNTPSASCAPMGACVQQDMQPNLNICWANGVKEFVTIALSGTNAVATAQVKGTNGAVCYSFDFTIDGVTGDVGALTFHDAAGKTLGTLTANADNSVTASCPGQPAKTIPASCNMDMNTMMPGGMPGDMKCTDGVCM